MCGLWRGGPLSSSGGFFVPYPLENGLYVLPPEERAEALVSS